MAISVIVALLIPGNVRETESYAIYDYYATTLLLRDGREAWFVTDAPEKYNQSLIDRTAFRLDEFFSRREIDSVKVVNELSRPGFRADGKRWSTMHSDVVLLNADWRGLSDDEIRKATATAREKELILLVTTGFRGNLPKICHIAAPDRIAISRRLSEERRERLSKVFKKSGITYSVGLEGEL